MVSLLLGLSAVVPAIANAAGAVRFAPAVNYPVASVPGSIAHGDLNGDGKQDLVTASSPGVASVLLGNGDGTFGVPTTTSLPTGDTPGSLAVGDLNGDGKLDVVVQNVSSVSVMLGKGDGTFAAPVDYAPATFGGAIASLSSIALVDVSGDGRADILLTESGTPPIYGVGAEVMLNNGDGTFGTPLQYPAGNTYNVGTSVTAADVNGDGLPDLILANNSCCFNYSLLAIFRGTGGGAFDPSPTTYTVQTGAASVRAGDFNGDGKPDLAVFSSGNPFYDGTQPAVSVLLNNGDGTFRSPVAYHTEIQNASAHPGAGPQYLTLADVNGDGALDAITTANDTQTAAVAALVNNGNGTFQPHQDFATDGGPTALTVADFNGDGKPDLATANQGGSDVSVLLNGTPFPSPLGTLTASGMSFSAAQDRLVTPTVASFSDSDRSTSISSYTASIDWGDGTPPDPAEVDSPNTVCQPCTVSYGHTYARPGTFTVTTTISKAGGGSPSGGGLVLVTSHARVASAVPARAVGILTAYDTVEKTFHSCTATVVASRSKQLILTAAHCVFGGNRVFQNFAFAPYHSGPLLGGSNPYGTWILPLSAGALPAFQYVLTGNPSYDFAFIVLPRDARHRPVGAVVAGLAATFNPRRHQGWTAYGYPSASGLAQCTNGTSEDQFTFSGPSQMVMPCPNLTEGSSGGPWINNRNGSAHGIGAVNSQQVHCSFLPIGCHPGLTATYLGSEARVLFNFADALAQQGGTSTAAVSSLQVKATVASFVYARVSNPPIRAIAGDVTLGGNTLRLRRGSAKAGAAAVRSRLILGFVKTAVPHHRSVPVVVRLTSRGRKWLHQHGCVITSVNLTVINYHGRRNVVDQSLTLLVRRGKHSMTLATCFRRGGK